MLRTLAGNVRQLESATNAAFVVRRVNDHDRRSALEVRQEAGPAPRALSSCARGTTLKIETRLLTAMSNDTTSPKPRSARFTFVLCSIVGKFASRTEDNKEAAGYCMPMAMPIAIGYWFIWRSISNRQCQSRSKRICLPVAIAIANRQSFQSTLEDDRLTPRISLVTVIGVAACQLSREPRHGSSSPIRRDLFGTLVKVTRPVEVVAVAN